MFSKITAALSLISAASAAAVPPVAGVSTTAAVPGVPTSTAATGVPAAGSTGAPVAGGAPTGGSVSVTPHASYGSSIGVLGCKVDVNRIAYWPLFPGCDNFCKKVTHPSGRSVTLLHIDQSGGAYDISYDAWTYLNDGTSAKGVASVGGGGIPATWENVPMSECADIIKTPDGTLPLSAANSMGTWGGCPVGSYLRDHSSLWNINNPNACTYGYNEQCTVDLLVSNQPACPHVLGAPTPLSGLPVENIDYLTGETAIAIQ